MATDKEKLEQAARLQQMNINARLVSLETAMKLMHAPFYNYEDKDNNNDKVIKGGKTDHITLIAMAQEIEGFILGNIEEETKQILEELKKPQVLRPHPGFKV
jgi:hypothetical protein